MEREMPIGLGFALAENEGAMAKFAGMSDNEKRQVIEAARGVQSKQEMRSLTEQIEKLNG